MKGILVALIAIAAITGIVTTGFAIAENKELPNPNVSIHMDYEEIRDDGVVVIHYSDGSKLFKAGMEDGISTSEAISKQIETELEDKVTVIEKLNWPSTLFIRLLNNFVLKVSGVLHKCKLKKRQIFYSTPFVKAKPYCKHCGEILSRDNILEYEVSDIAEGSEIEVSDCP